MNEKVGLNAQTHKIPYENEERHMLMKMNQLFLIIASLLVGSFLLMLPATSYADAKDYWRRKHHEDLEEHDEDFQVPINQTYSAQCGSCHLAYPPELLPAASWRKILSELPDHNGEQVELESPDKETVDQFLETNAADKSSSRRARRIIKSLHGETPTRITEVPYIRHQHDDISETVYQRESIGSFSNCNACHPSAERGKFNADSVRIPLDTWREESRTN